MYIYIYMCIYRYIYIYIYIIKWLDNAYMVVRETRRQ